MKPDPNVPHEFVAGEIVNAWGYDYPSCAICGQLRRNPAHFSDYHGAFERIESTLTEMNTKIDELSAWVRSIKGETK